MITIIEEMSMRCHQRHDTVTQISIQGQCHVTLRDRRLKTKVLLNATNKRRKTSIPYREWWRREYPEEKRLQSIGRMSLDREFRRHVPERE